MRVIAYFDSSAAIKRVIDEAESAALVEALDRVRGEGAQLVTSDLARVELARLLRRRESASREVDIESRAALMGIAVAPLTQVVIELACMIDPPVLRSLDAIHLATAVAVGADEVWTYDARLRDAARAHGFAVRSPA